MSDNDDWMADADKEQDKPAPEKAENSSGRVRGRGSEKAEEEPNKNDESDWVTDRKQEKVQEPSRRGRNRQEEEVKPKVQENISEIIHDSRRQLTADPAQETWGLEKEKPKKQQEEEAPRGNRGNRGNRQDQNQQGADEGRSRGNRGNREGGGNEERGFQRNNQRNHYGGGNQRGYNDNRDGDNQGERGRGRGRGRGGFGGNRDFGNREFSNRQGQDNQGGFNNRFGGDRDNRENRDNRGTREYNGNRDFNNDRFRNNPPNPNQNEQTDSTIVKATVASVPKIQQVVPRGRKVWPECSIFIRGCRFTITYRQINQTGAKCLVIPYSSLKLQLYPGNLINASTVDYRKHIEAKGEEISKPGDIYIQKAKEVGSFQAVIFLKVVESEMKECFSKGSKSVLDRLGALKDFKLDDVVFPISEKMGDPADVILPILENLDSHKEIKQVFVSTNEAKCFHKAIQVFQSAFDKLVEDNEISIQNA